MHLQRLIDHLQHLVSLYPCTDNQSAVLDALHYCQTIMEKSGIFEDLKIHKQQGFYSLTGSSQGKKRPKLLLQAHVDVVPCAAQPQLHIDTASGMINGRGVYDMLFAVASYLTFIEEHADELDQLDIGIMLTGDEELGGFHGTGHLIDNGYNGEICILPDAGEGFGDLSVASKGVYNFDLVVNGRSHHGSRPWEGDGAANKLVYLLHELLEAFDESDRHNSTMTVTSLKGGDCVNRGPETAKAHLDIRYKDMADFQRLQKIVEQLCDRYDAKLHNVLLADSLELDHEHPHIKTFLELYEKHADRPITLSKAHGGSDARFFAARGTPVILLRPDGGGAHSENERLSRDSFERFYLLLEHYIMTTASI